MTSFVAKGAGPLPARLVVAATMAAVVLPASAVADPPPWAPAHGYRAKQGNHLAYSREADRRIIVLDDVIGACNRDVIGLIIGGAAGGVAGAQVGKGDGRTLATVAGAVLGAVAGHAMGAAMDRLDRHCMAAVMERAPANRAVGWQADGRRYVVEPENDVAGPEGRLCRDYTMRVTVGGEIQAVRGRACREPDGDWRIMS